METLVFEFMRQNSNLQTRTGLKLLPMRRVRTEIHKKRVERKPMSSKRFHWCKNGCGKCVIYIFIGYECRRCNKMFTKEELDD